MLCQKLTMVRMIRMPTCIKEETSYWKHLAPRYRPPHGGTLLVNGDMVTQQPCLPLRQMPTACL